MSPQFQTRCPGWGGYEPQGGERNYPASHLYFILSTDQGNFHWVIFVMNPSLGKESQIQTEISDPNQWGCPETTWCTHGLKTLDQDARYSSFCFDSTVEFAGRSPTASVEQCLCRVFGNTQFGLSCFCQLGQRNRLFPSDLPAGYCTAMTWITAVPPSLAQEICQQEESAKEVIAALWLYSHSY